ncbi:MAG: PRC-barrel domain-containing protein [Cyanobacteria bacterium J06598_1]
MDTTIIRQGELVGRGIMAYETTEEVGSVAHLLVDMKTAVVTGLTYKPPGLIGRKQALDWSQLVKIGGDRIVIQTEVPEAVASQLSAAQDITDLEVWTDGGDHIGHIVDVCFDQSRGQVQQYLFALKVQESSSDSADADPSIVELFGEEADTFDETEMVQKTRVYQLLPQTIISAGRKRVMIAEEAAKEVEPYAQLLDLTAAKAASSLRADWQETLPTQLPEMPTDFNELLKKGQSLVGQVGERVKQTAKKLTDEQLAEREFGEAGTLPEITEQLQEKTDKVRQQMQERLEKAREKAQDQLDKSGLEERLDKTLGKTSLGRSLNKQLDRFKRPQAPTEPIDVDSFEVWEDD